MKYSDITFINDVDKAISVMRNAGQWLKDSGKNPSEYWHVQNLTRNYLLKRAEPNEFFVGLIEGKPAIACLLQETERNQSWKYIDGDTQKSALYIHWLSVDRKFAGKNLSKEMIKFASSQAKIRNLSLLRLDTEANKTKLQKIYEDLGFTLMGIDGNTSFYQKEV